MKKLFTTIFAGILCMLFGTLTISEVNAMNIQALDNKQQHIVTIAAFTATGDLNKLQQSLTQGLDAGLSVNEIKEVLVQMYAYCGFPRSLNGINTFMSVLQERSAKGIHDPLGAEPTPLAANKSKLELGTANQTALVGQSVHGALYEFAPTIDVFLKEHLFADIFGRDNLNFQNREIATIAALATIDGAQSQLQAHFNIGYNTGLSEVQMLDIVSVLKNKVGSKEGNNAQSVLIMVNKVKNN